MTQELIDTLHAEVARHRKPEEWFNDWTSKLLVKLHSESETIRLAADVMTFNSALSDETYFLLEGVVKSARQTSGKLRKVMDTIDMSNAIKAVQRDE